MKRRIFTLIVILLFSLLIILVNIVAHQYNVRLDLTKSKQHTLSLQSQEIISQIDQDITITALHVGMPPKYLDDILNEYERLSAGKIKATIIDPLVDLGYAAQFGNIISGKEKKVVVQSAGERRDIDFTDELLTEELLSNAIIRVLREKREACFLAGHGEYRLEDKEDHGLSILGGLLMSNNIRTQELLLTMSGTIPNDCDVLVIAGAKNHLNEEEIDIIDEYLLRGGDALVLVEHILVTTPDKPLKEEELELNPSLDGLLNRWGVRVNNDVVVDLDSHALGDVGSPATKNYLSHRSIVSGLDYTFYVRPRSVSLFPDRRKTIKLAPLVLSQSKEKSWGETDRMLKVDFDRILDRAGPVPIAFVAWEKKEEGEASDTRIIVFSDADFLSNGYIGAYSNAQMALNSFNWLSESDFKAFKDKRVFKVERLDLLSHQKNIIRIILLLMPILILLVGVGVWITKR